MKIPDKNPINGNPYCNNDKIKRTFAASDTSTVSPTLPSMVFSILIILSSPDLGEQRNLIPHPSQLSVVLMEMVKIFPSIFVITP